jgi:potassium-transporting ATPase KdpC subunit
MRAQLLAALKVVVAFTLILGLAYPLIVTGIAQVAFNDKADGSLIEQNGRVIGSSLIGQQFTGDRWFHPRPSAAGDGYDPQASSGSNLGPTNPELIETVEERVQDYREQNGLAADTRVPVDAVTTSASGLDPHISKANARLQARRVADARGFPVARVRELIDANTDDPSFGFLGEPGVNVLKLNLALKRAARS